MRKNIILVCMMLIAMLNISAYATPAPICQSLVNTCWVSKSSTSTLQSIGIHLGGPKWSSTLWFLVLGGSGGNGIHSTCTPNPQGATLTFSYNQPNYPTFITHINANLSMPNDKEITASGYVNALGTYMNVPLTTLVKDPNLSDCNK